MDDKEVNSSEKSVVESIEDQFDDLFAPKKPDEDTDAVKKAAAQETTPVKKKQSEISPLKPSDKKETANKVPVSKKEQSSLVRPQVKSNQQKIPSKKTLIKQVTSSEKTERSKSVVEQASPANGKEIPPENSGKPSVQNVFKKANQKYKKSILPDKVKQGLFPLLFTSLILLLVLLSMFTGKILVPDEVMEFFNIKKSPAFISKPVLTGDAGKRENVVSRDKKAFSPKIEMKEAEIEKPDIQSKVPLEEEKRVQGATGVVISTKKSDESNIFINGEIKSYPYSIYLGSYGSIDKIKTATADFMKLGMATYWIKMDLGEKGTWFRLFTGYFQTREQADAFIKAKNLKDAESKLTKYTNLIGVYKSKEDAYRQKARLEELGYSPYIISGTGKVYRLYAGAFYQEERAEDFKKDLELNGIKSELVER